MKIYKNFLNKNEFKNIQNQLVSPQFPWYLGNIISPPLKTPKFNNQFFHIFYSNDLANSNYYNIVSTIKDKIKWLTLLRVKANIIIKTEKIIEHGMHIDFDEKKYKIHTGILYVNTNNGYTKFSNGEIVKSEENKYVEFDSQLEHTGTSCTDQDYRIVINFNYLK